jgi:hypothetical protein
VTPVQLDQHAASVDDLAALVKVAAQAEQAVQFDSDAYGEFCQALPVMMAPPTNLVIDALGSTVDNLTGVGVKVRTAAENYRASDTEASARFGAM